MLEPVFRNETAVRQEIILIMFHFFARVQDTNLILRFVSDGSFVWYWVTLNIFIVCFPANSDTKLSIIYSGNLLAQLISMFRIHL